MFISTLRCSLKKGLVLLALFYIGLLSACAERSKTSVLAFEGPTMGTRFHVKVIVSASVDVEQQRARLLDISQDKLREINQSMSTYISDSTLQIFNQTGVDVWFDVDAELCEVLSVADTVSQASFGAFDISVGPLVNAWGFGPYDVEELPSENDIQTIMANIGYESLDLDCASNQIRKQKMLTLDLSSVAKGYAADLLAEEYSQLGYADFMIEIGGELFVRGLNAERQPWLIAIEKPAFERSGAIQVLQLSDVGVATSGEYRNYYERDGQRVSHTIDPTTGHPINHTLASVTVITDSAGEADAWATALNVLGPEKGQQRAEQLGLAAYFIVRKDDGFIVNYTSSFTQYMVNP